VFNFGTILISIQETLVSLIYYINVQSPNLDLKQGISYLERERGRGWRDLDRGERDRLEK
jgi:hypothetical protein